MKRRKWIHPLEAWRERHELNQRDAARKYGVTQGTWSKWERGVAHPRRQKAAAIMRETGIPLADLMGVSL